MLCRLRNEGCGAQPDSMFEKLNRTPWTHTLASDCECLRMKYEYFSLEYVCIIFQIATVSSCYLGQLCSIKSSGMLH
jgi:hypothetical protein